MRDIQRTVYLPSCSYFHLEALIGNTLHDHRVLTRPVLPCFGWTHIWRRIVAMSFGKVHADNACLCGWVSSSGEVFEYHQARSVIDALEHPDRRGGDRPWKDPKR